LTITTTSTTPLGTSTIAITGTSGSMTHSANATLVVATPDFSISATPSSRTVRRGSSTTYTVTVTPSGAFNGKVTLGVSGLPSNVTGTFNPSTVTGSGSSTLQITTRSNTTRGTYPLTITGTCSSPALQHTTSPVTLIVN
jgi:uncharacterized membrane protein